MWRAAFLPCPTPTVTVRSLGTMSPPANTPGAPVISDADTFTVPSALELDSRHGAQEGGVGLLAERQDHGVRRQRLEAPGRLRITGLVEFHQLDLQLGPSNAVMVRSQLIRTPSRSASSASSAWAGICSRVRR